MESLDPISRWAQTVNWTAWGAIGSVLAVVLAVWLAGMASRDARARDLAKIQSLVVLANGLRTIYEGCAKEERIQQSRISQPEILNTFGELRAVIDGIQITDLPTPKSVDAFMRIASHLQAADRLNSYLSGSEAERRVFAKFCRRAEIIMGQVISDLGEDAFGVRYPATGWVRKKLAQFRAPSPPSGGD